MFAEPHPAGKCGCKISIRRLAKPSRKRRRVVGQLASVSCREPCERQHRVGLRPAVRDELRVVG
eukprot:scaffold119123_cov26-Tisochrysis_lutea.AAC.1